MLNNVFDILVSIKYPLIGLFFSFIALSFYWTPIFKFFKLKSYDNVQRVHKSEVSRLGGLIIYFFLWTIYLNGFHENNLFFYILTSAFPIIVVNLKEDLHHNTSPLIRLFSMLISCLIFFYLYPIDLPEIDIPLIGQFISSYPLAIIFFTFSIIVVMNGMNLIDGMNGLFGFTATMQMILVAFIALKFNDIALFNTSIIFTLPLIFFLFFNFPLGKIFIGDLGAYLYGFIISILIIYLFGKHQELLSWLAVLILFYPCMELLFSYTRKVKNRHSPFDADSKHLHTLINSKLKKIFNNSLQSNNICTLSLFVFWLTPFFFCKFIPINFKSIIFTIILLVMLYLLFYRLAMKSIK